MILPFTILRRLDCILEPTKDQVLAEYKKIQSTKVDPDVLLKAKFKLPFYNTSRWTFASLVGDPEGVADNLVDYIEHFSPNVRDVFDGFGLIDEIAQPGQVGPLVSDRQRVRRRRPVPERRLGPRHGLHLRRTHPQVRRLQRHPGW